MSNETAGNVSVPSHEGFDPEYLRAGQIIAETFALRSVIPSALGEFPVWLAEDEVAGRQVCLHFVPAEVSKDPDLRAALKEEVKKTRNLHHESILRVHELIEGEDWAAVVTNAYEGESLARRLQEESTGFFESSEVKGWIDPVLRTMADVHSVPVLHRNLSPADIIITSKGEVLLSGFGTRRVIVDALRRSGVREGKYLSHTSPQLFGGAAATISDDIYSIGATLFQLLTGKRVFEGTDVENNIRVERPPGVVELRHKLNRDGQELYANWERTIAQCLSKDPGERPVTIGDLVKRLAGQVEPEKKSVSPVAAALAAKAAAAKASAQTPQHMGVAGSEEEPEEEGAEANERISAPRPMLTSFPPERRSGGKKLALAALLVLAGAVGAWFGASFFFEKNEDFEEDEPAEVAAAPKIPEPEQIPDAKFVAPTEPGSTPELTALRPGTPPKPKVGLPNGVDPGIEGLPTPVTMEPPPRDASTAAAKGSANVGPLASSKTNQTPVPPIGEDPDIAAQRALDLARIKAESIKQDGIAKREQELARKAQEVERMEQELAKKEQEELAKIKAEKAAPPVVAPPPAKLELPPAKAELPPVAKAELPAPQPKAEPAKPASEAKPTAQAAKLDTPGAVENSIGMKFVQMGDVQVSTCKTRLKDYAQFVKETGYPKTRWKSPGFAQTPDDPVVMVSWTDALSFCKWLTDKEHAAGLLKPGESYRLPTDLEWSKGVGLPLERGASPEMRDMGIQDQYPWGTQWPPPKGAGNYTGKETGAEVYIPGYDDGYAHTSPVGSFPPNAQGLYDMGGNAWEWCMDTWNPKARSRVLRGGSWFQGALQLSLLSSCRIHSMPDKESDNYSFRVVRATPGKTR